MVASIGERKRENVSFVCESRLLVCACEEQCDEIGPFLKFLGTKVAQIFSKHFWAIVKNGTFYVKLTFILFGQLLEKIGQLFTPTSGHSGEKYEMNIK